MQRSRRVRKRASRTRVLTPACFLFVMSVWAKKEDAPQQKKKKKKQEGTMHKKHSPPSDRNEARKAQKMTTPLIWSGSVKKLEYVPM